MIFAGGILDDWIGQRTRGESETMRRLAHRDYETAFYEMRSEWTPVELALAIAGGYDKPLPYEGPHRGHADNGDQEFHDPSDRAVDYRIPIVDFEAATESELQTHCDKFRSVLVWATRGGNGRAPDLMQMGARMLAIFEVAAPEVKIGMDLRIPKKWRAELLSLLGNNAAQIGEFFLRPLLWVRKCSALEQVGKRGYSMIYILCGDLIDSATCAAIGELDNKSRQAANKPVQDFRDSFGGIKSLPMRGKETRKRCKESQENN